MSRINKTISYVCTPVGLMLLLVWRDIGATVFLIGAVNYALYKKEIDGAVI
jgi:hypothetical protein